MTGAAAFLVAWGACVLTCCPTVSYDDTGEFCVAALQLGVPHPPGYPLYVLVMALARHLPAGSFAFRLNLLGALWAACAAAVLAALWRRSARGPAAAGAAAAVAAVLASGPWGQATTAKGGVYLLNAFLAAGVLWVPFSRLRDGGRAAAMGLLTGLALANHWMTAAALLPAVAILLGARGAAAPGRRAAVAICALVLGVSVYTILPVLASHRPFLNWCSTDRAAGFAFSVGRRQYGGAVAGETAAPIGDRIAAIGAAMAGAAPPLLLVPLAAGGMVVMALTAGREVAAAASVLVSLYAGLMAYGPLRAGAPWYFEIFSVPGTILIGWFALAGLAAAGAWAGARVARGRTGYAAAGAGAMVVLGVALLALREGAARWRACDRSHEYLTWDLAVNLDAQTAGRGMLFANSDVVVFGNWHHWLVEGRRRGAVVVPAPLLPMQWVARGFAGVVPGLRAPLPLPTAGAESIPALMRAWEEGNRARFTSYTFISDTARAAWPEGPPRPGAAVVRLVEHGWVYRVAKGPAARSSRPEVSAGRALRLRGLLSGEIDREPRKYATFQPIGFSGLLAMGDAAVELAGPRGAGGRARRFLSRCMALARSDGDRARVESALGALAAREGRWSDAAVRFERSADLSHSPSALMNLVMLRLRLGQDRETVAAVKRLMREAPNSDEAKSAADLLKRLEQRGGVKR